MDGLLVGHVLVFAASAIVCLASVPRARAIQHAGTRHGLVGLLVSVAAWSAGYVGYLVASSRPLQIGFYLAGFCFAFLAVGSFFYFCAAYTGRSPRHAPYRGLAVGVFVLVLSLKVTNPLHHLYFTSAWTTTPFPHLAIQPQLLYWVVLGASYAGIAVGFFMLFERFYHTGADSRPLMVLAAFTGAPTVATLLESEIGWLLPLMYEPPGVAAFAVGTLFVYRRRFEAVQLTAGTNDPAVFLDGDGRIRDYNRAARSLVPALEEFVGDPIGEVEPALADGGQTPGMLTRPGVDGGTRYYQVSRTPLTSGEVVTGELMTLSDVTERERYRQRLEARTEQLEALNRIVRHDIRNDMAVIYGWAETLRGHVDADSEEALERVLRKSQHVIEFTETVRDFVEAVSGEESMEVSPVALRPHLRGEVLAITEAYSDAEIRVADDIPEVSVMANEMVSSVFRNILENAVRHSDVATPEIVVSVTMPDDVVRVRVADNGPGIPDEQKEAVFGKGEKGIESGGTGIGLYLVSMLVEQFGGRVWIEDNDPRGAVFVIELERAPTSM